MLICQRISSIEIIKTKNQKIYKFGIISPESKGDAKMDRKIRGLGKKLEKKISAYKKIEKKRSDILNDEKKFVENHLNEIIGNAKEDYELEEHKQIIEEARKYAKAAARAKHFGEAGKLMAAIGDKEEARKYAKAAANEGNYEG